MLQNHECYFSDSEIIIITMDQIDFFSSSEEGNEQIRGIHDEASRETPSTDNEHVPHKKSKNSKKVYEPIQDGNIVIRYEDDPIEYKKLRKKIQNRESAARIRGRKKGTIDNLQDQVQGLKKMNSELLLKNAALQTQNRTLKNEVEFLRSVVKQPGNQNIQQFLDIEHAKSQKNIEEYESPFNEDNSFNWMRAPVFQNGPGSSWSTLFILSVVVCVFVLPSSQGDSSVIAQQASTTTTVPSTLTFEIALGWIKYLFRYLIIIGYVYFLSKSVYKNYLLKKRKKV